MTAYVVVEAYGSCRCGKHHVINVMATCADHLGLLHVGMYKNDSDGFKVVYGKKFAIKKL